MKRTSYSCLVFGEGGKDKKFLIALIDLDKFKHHTKKWTFNYDNASGSSPETILNKCWKAISGTNYDLILCFIDLDKLKTDYPEKWKENKKRLENKYSNITIMWQIDNMADEFRKVLRDHCRGKNKLNRAARKKVKEFINSDFWKRILKPIKDKEQELEV